MNKYKMCNGERISISERNKKIRNAKKEKLQKQLNEFDYNFCEDCYRSGGVYISRQMSKNG